MSAPDTDVKKQQKRHRFPLVGMAWMVIWAIGLLIAMVIYLSWSGNEPGNSTPIDEESATQ